MIGRSAMLSRARPFLAPARLTAIIKQLITVAAITADPAATRNQLGRLQSRVTLLPTITKALIQMKLIRHY